MTDQDREAQNDYLWDGTGVPDEAIVRLENASAARHRGSLPRLPARRRRSRSPMEALRWLAAAAALVLSPEAPGSRLSSAAQPGR